LDIIIINMVNISDTWHFKQIEYYDIIKKTTIESKLTTNIFYDLSEIDTNTIDKKMIDNQNIIFALRFLLSSISDIKIFKLMNLEKYNEYCVLSSKYFGKKSIYLINGLISDLLPSQYFEGVPIYFTKRYDNFVEKCSIFEQKLLTLD
jgi:hypothetical protein